MSLLALERGLTAAMRRALSTAHPDSIDGNYRVYDRGIVRKALRNRGLGHGDFCYLTPLGAALRAHILGEKQ